MPIQKSRNYLPLVLRNLAVPAASFGSRGAIFILFGGFFLSGVSEPLGGMMMDFALLLFGAVVVFQVVNLPVEFDASNRAKAELVNLNIVSAGEMTGVNRVLNAAAMTYVAATLAAVTTFLYYLMRFGGRD